MYIIYREIFVSLHRILLLVVIVIVVVIIGQLGWYKMMIGHIAVAVVSASILQHALSIIPWNACSRRDQEKMK